MTQLILAEKPSQARDIAKGLGGGFNKKDGYIEREDYVITWALGHLISLADAAQYEPRYKRWNLKDLPILPEVYRYKPIRKTMRQLKVIKALLCRSGIGAVVIATDPGREGELIARLILSDAKNKKPTYRFWISKALTPEAVQEGFAHLKNGRDFDPLYRSALARQQADWLVGINATRAFTLHSSDLYSLGRVQTPILAIICRREWEIEAFRPEDYWLVKAKFRHAGLSRIKEYEGLWVRGETPDESSDSKEEGDGATATAASKIASAHEALAIIGRIRKQPGRVISYREVPKEDRPPYLFSLTTLQMTANQLYGFTASRTLESAQSLYEVRKAISYPRTESRHLNAELANPVIQTLDRLARASVIPFERDRCTVSTKNRRIFDTTKLTDHHAIIPTGVIPSSLSGDDQKIYELIVKRFVAAFYPNCRYTITRIMTKVGEDHFQSVGKTIIQMGWKEVYGTKEKDPILPQLEPGQYVTVLEAEEEKKQTTPPAHYTDASILSAMMNAGRFVRDAKLKAILKETAGIGTPATRASILETLKARGYIERKGKSLIPTSKGSALIRAVEDERVADPAYTATWEQELEMIASGETRTSEEFMERIRTYTREIVERAKEVNGGTTRTKKPFKKRGHNGVSNKGLNGQVLGKCPDCGRDVKETPYDYSCEGSRSSGCSFTLRKNTLQSLGKSKLTRPELELLLSRKIVRMKGFVSKVGRGYSAPVKLEKTGRFGWSVQFQRGPGI